MKVLIIRSAPMRRYVEVLPIVRTQYPDAEISVLSHCSANADILTGSPVRLFNYTGKRIRLWTLGWDLLMRLRRERFDSVVILYTDLGGIGYEPVLCTAFALNAKRVYACTLANTFVSFSPRRYIRAYVFEYCMFVVYFFIWCFLCIRSTFKGISRGQSPS